MTNFADFLSQRLETGGFTTEDALASFLPLVRQVAAAHRAGLVAPLQGVNRIQVENARLWFEESLLHKPALNETPIKGLEQPGSQAAEIVGQLRMKVAVDQGPDAIVDLQIGARGEPLARPVYLPGYVSWEHELGHHDPLTDVFVLGLILASLTCGLNLNDPEDLAAFVQRRRNLCSGPHCLDQKKAFLSYTPEASGAPRPLSPARFFRPALPSPGLREGGAEKPVPLQRPRRYTTSGVLYSKDWCKRSLL